MLTLLKGGRIIDPVNGATRSAISGSRTTASSRRRDGRKPDEVHDVSGKIVMAGAIDIHSHIAGGNVNTARLLLPEKHRAHMAAPSPRCRCPPPMVDLRDRADSMPPWASPR